MASVLSNGTDQLVVAAFGKRLAFTSAQNVVTCSSGDIVETPGNVKTVLSAAVAWIDSPSQEATFGPVFGERFKFFTSGTKKVCYATHDEKLGIKENPEALRYVMNRVTTWLSDHGV